MMLGSIEAVVAALQEDARVEIETVERDLTAAIARLRAEDAALPVVIADADARLAAARRKVREQIAAEDWADHQMALSDRERWIRIVTAEGQRRLEALDSDVLDRDLVELAGEALDRMPQEPLVLLVPAPRLAAAERLVRTNALAASGRTIAEVRAAADLASGCIVETADGRLRCENSYGVRARRFEPVWRAALGRLYEAGPAAVAAAAVTAPGAAAAERRS